MVALETKGQTENLVFITGKLITFFIILTHYLRGFSIEPAVVVKILSWSDILKITMTWISFASQYGTEMLVSLNRIQVYPMKMQ